MCQVICTYFLIKDLQVNYALWALVKMLNQKPNCRIQSTIHDLQKFNYSTNIKENFNFNLM